LTSAAQRLARFGADVRALVALLDGPEAGPEAVKKACAACATGFAELRSELDGAGGVDPELTGELEQLLRLHAVAAERVGARREALVRELGITRQVLQAARSRQSQTGLGDACDVRG